MKLYIHCLRDGHRRTGMTELGGAAPVCPKKIFFLPKKFPDLGGQKPCLPEHFARKSFTYYINFGSFAWKKIFWGGCRPPPPPPPWLVRLWGRGKFIHDFFFASSRMANAGKTKSQSKGHEVSIIYHIYPPYTYIYTLYSKLKTNFKTFFLLYMCQFCILMCWHLPYGNPKFSITFRYLNIYI